MEDNHRAQPDLTQKEIDLIDQLRRKPLIMQRVQEILSLANAGDGPLKTADQIEEMLVQEMRHPIQVSPSKCQSPLFILLISR